MTHGPLTIIHPVRDLEAAKGVYAALLGTEPYVDEPDYVGFSAAGLDVGLDPNGHRKDMNAPRVYWHVDDIPRRSRDSSRPAPRRRTRSTMSAAGD